MTTNQERAAEILSEYDLEPQQSDFAAHALANDGLLMPDLPEPKWPGFWEVDGLEINLADKDGEVNLDWREGDYYRGEDRSLWLNRQQVLAIIAAAKLAEERK